MNQAEFREYLQHLYDDFPYFYTEVSRVVGLNEPSRMRLDIAHWMQHGPARRGVLASRKIGKTFILGAYCDWRGFRNAQEQILHCSQSTDFAKKSVSVMRKWLDHVPFLRHMAPQGREKERDNELEFDFGTAKLELIHSASVTARGITGQLPGLGATLACPDDIETPENTLTQDGRALLEQRSDNIESLMLPEGDILYLGTPQCKESIYRKLLDRGYTFRAWPVAYPKSSENIPGLAPIITEDLRTGRAKPGDPVFPDVFTAEEIALKRLRTSPSTFAMQFMLRTDLIDSEVRPLRLDDLMVLPNLHRDLAPVNLVWGHNSQSQSTRLPIPSVGFGNDGYYAPVMIDSDWKPYHGTKAALDPAVSASAKGDEMAWAIAGQLHGNIFLKAVYGVRGGATPENLEKIVLSLREHDARELIIETNFGGAYLIPLIEPVIRKFCIKAGEDERFPNGWSCSIPQEGTHAVGQKEKRIIESLSPVTRQHRLIVAKAVAEDTEWAHQFVNITEERGCLDHDDRIEATSMVVAAFKDVLYQNSQAITDRQIQEKQLEALKKLNSRFATPELTWIDAGLRG